MDNRRIAARADAIARASADSVGVSIVDTEFVRDSGYWYLRIYIDKPGGVAIDDCADLSEAVGKILDSEDFIPQSYILEVSSSGEKPLRSPEEYNTFRGRWALLSTYADIQGRRRFEGRLIGADEAEAKIEVDGTVYSIPLTKIAHARLAVPLEEVRNDESE